MKHILGPVYAGLCEPWGIFGYVDRLVDDMAALIADDTSRIPYLRPKVRDVGCRPEVQIVIRLERQAEFSVDPVSELECSRCIRVLWAVKWCLLRHRVWMLNNTGLAPRIRRRLRVHG